MHLRGQTVSCASQQKDVQVKHGKGSIDIGQGRSPEGTNRSQKSAKHSKQSTLWDHLYFSLVLHALFSLLGWNMGPFRVTTSSFHSLTPLVHYSFCPSLYPYHLSMFGLHFDPDDSIYSSKRLVNYQTTWHHIPEDKYTSHPL
jgi:hypothetical protein